MISCDILSLISVVIRSFMFTSVTTTSSLNHRTNLFSTCTIRSRLPIWQKLKKHEKLKSVYLFIFNAIMTNKGKIFTFWCVSYKIKLIFLSFLTLEMDHFPHFGLFWSNLDHKISAYSFQLKKCTLSLYIWVIQIQILEIGFVLRRTKLAGMRNS